MKNNKQGKNKNPNDIRKVKVKLNPGFANNHITIECYHKLNRIIAVSNLVGANLRNSASIASSNAGLSQLLSYFSEDAIEILHELESKGLCDEWLRKSVNS